MQSNTVLELAIEVNTIKKYLEDINLKISVLKNEVRLDEMSSDELLKLSRIIQYIQIDEMVDVHRSIMEFFDLTNTLQRQGGKHEENSENSINLCCNQFYP